MSWAIRSSWWVTFWMNCKEHIMVDQFSSLASTSKVPYMEFEMILIHEVWNYLDTLAFQTTSFWEIVPSCEKSRLATVGKDKETVWDLSNVLRVHETKSTLTIAIRYCFQPCSRTRTDLVWNESSTIGIWYRVGFQISDVSTLSNRKSCMGCICDLLGIFVHWIYYGDGCDKRSAFTSVRWTNRAKAVGTDVL